MALKPHYRQFEFVNLSMGALGAMSKSSTSFLEMMKGLDLDENTRKFIVRRLMNIAIQSTYYVFASEARTGWIQNCGHSETDF